MHANKKINLGIAIICIIIFLLLKSIIHLKKKTKIHNFQFLLLFKGRIRISIIKKKLKNIPYYTEYNLGTNLKFKTYIISCVTN